MRWTRGKILLAIIIPLWLCAAAAGVMAMHRYDETPGAAASAPSDWPAATQLVRDSNRYSLLVFLHPQCPCSRATVEELSQLMARVQSRESKLAVTVLMDRPDGEAAGWEKTTLWKNASAIPGVRVLSDPRGAEAQRFGAQTSGQTMLYDRAGRLLFSGGITASRGHAGENAGLDAVLERLDMTSGHSLPAASTPVFGCELFDSPKRSRSTP